MFVVKHNVLLIVLKKPENILYDKLFTVAFLNETNKATDFTLKHLNQYQKQVFLVVVLKVDR